MGLVIKGNDIGVYKACIRDTNSLKDLALSSLFGKDNKLNLGPVPSFLPILTAVEEFLIACVYIYLQVMRIRGQQYRYTGHIYCFGQNTPKTWRQLLQLSAKLNILIIRPVMVTGTKYLSQRFSKRYTVRYSAIEYQLYFLKINYLDYCNFKIYSNQLTSLLKNGSILNQLPSINKLDSNFSDLIASPPPILQATLASIGNSASTISHPPVGLSNNMQDGEFNNNILDTLVPNLVPDLSELELLRREVQYQEGLQAGLKVPTVQQTPLFK